MSNLRREFWRHRPSGLVWAVELMANSVIGCCGPLALEDADPKLLDHLEYQTRELSWFRESVAEFEALMSGGHAAAA